MTLTFDLEKFVGKNYHVIVDVNLLLLTGSRKLVVTVNGLQRTSSPDTASASKSSKLQ